MMPLELFPRWLGAAARWLPFRFMLAAPVEMITALSSRADALRDLGIQAAYVVALALLARAAWRVGLRRYSAFGG